MDPLFVGMHTDQPFILGGVLVEPLLNTIKCDRAFSNGGPPCSSFVSASGAPSVQVERLVMRLLVLLAQNPNQVVTRSVL